jgi:hypothetical protein
MCSKVESQFTNNDDKLQAMMFNGTELAQRSFDKMTGSVF